jgi:hypothetical protein
MLLNFGILLVALIIYLVCNPGSVSAFIENGANGVKEYNEQKREDKIREAVRDKRKELIAKGYSENECKIILFHYDDWLRQNGLGAKSQFRY